MKPLGASARPLEERSPAPALQRVPRPSPAQLRRDRDRLFREGKFDRARRVAQQLAELEPSRESLFKLGVILRDGGDPRGSLRPFRDALRFREGAAYLVPEIHFHRAHAWYLLGKYKRMGESLRRAYASRPRPRSDAKLHLCFGTGHLSYRKYREAHAEFVEAEKAARNPLGRGRALVNQSVALYYRRDLREADRLLARAIRLFEKRRHPADLANARAMRGSFYLDAGQFSRSMSIQLRAARSFESMGNLHKAGESLHGVGYAMLEMGAWSEARSHLDRAIELGMKTGHRNSLIASHACRAIAAAKLDDFDRATSDLAEARRHLKGARYWIGSLHVYRAQARIAALFENWAEVRRWAGRAERLALSVNDVVRVAEFRGLRGRAEAALGRRRAALHARKGVASLQALLGAGTGGTPEAVANASRLARSRVPALIVGESGVGKTLLAREMHRLGPRSKGPCIVVPCERLAFAGSDVAGHEKGAWSGAREGSLGYAGKADGGSLIFDRIDELSAADQRALIPVVEGRLRPVGSTQERRIDVRVIAVAQDRSKIVPGLRTRLAGAEIVVLPLRKRPADIPPLVRRLLGARAITADALGLLAAHPWHGNLVELNARMKRLAALEAGPVGVNLVRRLLKTPERDRVAVQMDELRRMAEALK